MCFDDACRIELSIDSRVDRIGVLSGALRGVGQVWNVSDRSMQQLELILVELVNNVIEHAYLNHHGHPVIVSLSWLPDNLLQLTVTDEGRKLPADLSSVLCQRKVAFPTPTDLPEGGWGLGLVCRLADDVEYTSDTRGNHLTVLKQLS